MRRLLACLLPFLLSPAASAQVKVRLGADPTVYRPFTLDALAGQNVRLPVVVANYTKKPLAVGNVLPDGGIPCPMFKVFDKAGGAPQIFNPALANCIRGESFTLAPGQKKTFQVDVPFRLTPGEYTAIVTVPTLPNPTPASTTLRIGPGPLIPQLRIPKVLKTGQPIPVSVAFTNTWRSKASIDLRLCITGLIIRNQNGKVVFDNRRERLLCPDILNETPFQPGQTITKPLFYTGQQPLKLPTGQYTAILWGHWNASTTFQVR
ncbi:hypothetical protein ACFOPQ_09060 [Deinococcus antarcticus]|uniref:Uncharacterized protein n=1 Tax=Deinococcus antarcticus TaxID=1298767 RepID=A0ABV8A674_9DEIO